MRQHTIHLRVEDLADPSALDHPVTGEPVSRALKRAALNLPGLMALALPIIVLILV